MSLGFIQTSQAVIRFRGDFRQTANNSISITRDITFRIESDNNVKSIAFDAFGNHDQSKSEIGFWSQRLTYSIIRDENTVINRGNVQLSDFKDNDKGYNVPRLGIFDYYGNIEFGLEIIVKKDDIFIIHTQSLTSFANRNEIGLFDTRYNNLNLNDNIWLANDNLHRVSDVVPEPRTYALFAGAASLVFVTLHRRRK